MEMHEYYEIKGAALPIFTEAGFVEDSEDNSPDAFGSIHTFFSRGEEKVRLRWDGKEGRGLAQKFDGKEWVDIPSYVPESEEGQFMFNIDKLCRALRTELIEK